MQLEELLAEIKGAKVSGSEEADIGALCYDSRKAAPGSLFIAIRGNSVDGHDFVEKAEEQGVTAILAECERPINSKVIWIQVTDSRRAMSQLAAKFYGEPSLAMKVAGVTGTNGKTTTGFLLHHLLKTTWHRAGLIGTVHYDLGDEVVEASHTTPESLELQGVLAEMQARACRGAVMEVSSHALEQKRPADVEFDAGIFTNLTRDHLDYHGTMEDYYEAKRELFVQLAGQVSKTKAVAVINIDDEYGRRLVKEFGGKIELITYGFGVQADFRAVDARFDFKGMEFQLDAKGRSALVRLPLIGRFNVYNALAALAAGSAMGINTRESIKSIADCPQVPGRLESVTDKQNFRVFVDYAHTPDALENAINTIRELEISRDFCPYAVEEGAVVVDESGYWRMDPKVPLIIPRSQSGSCRQNAGIIASPNCSTTQMVVALAPLHKAARVRRVVVSTYQATSGAGLAGNEELNSSVRSALTGQVHPPETFQHPIGFNLIPQIGSEKHEGYTSEEMKMVSRDSQDHG